MQQKKKNPGNPAICYNMDGPWWHYAKWDTIWYHLYVDSKTIELLENRLVVARDQGLGERRLKVVKRYPQSQQVIGKDMTSSVTKND